MTSNTVSVGVLVLLCCAYFALRRAGIIARPLGDMRELVLLSYVPIFLFVSGCLFGVMFIGQRHYSLRQALAKANLYTAIAFLLVMEGELCLLGGPWVIPIYTIMIWLVLHLSLRYGYLGIAAAIVGIQIASSIFIYNDLLSLRAANLVVTVSSLALLLPAYILLQLKLAEKRRDASNRAEARKSRFVAHTAHELGQPLNATRLFIGQLRQTQLDADQAAMVDQISQSINGIDTLFRTLLDIAMLDGDALSVKIQDVPLRPLLIALVAQNREAAERAGVSLEVRCADQVVRTDPVLLSTMLQNLVSNAIRYAPGGPVSIEAVSEGGRVALTVRDHGPGVPKEQLNRLFEEFYRLPSEGNEKPSGAGLGLSIVRRLADITGLQVSVELHPDGGILATIAGLPLAAEKPA